MKKAKIFASTVLFIFLISLFISCKPKEEPVVIGALFSGTVVTTDGKPLPEVKVWIGESETETTESGSFTMTVPSARRYVMNIYMKGFGLVSKVFFTPVQDNKYVLTRATVQFFDATGPILLTDNQNDCFRIQFTNSPQITLNEDQIPVYNTNGELIGFGMSDELKNAFEYERNRTTCNTGVQVSIPAGALVDQNGNDATGEVSVAVSTIDLFSPDGMPGDFTVENERNVAMESFGAGSVEIFSGGSTYQLKAGYEAEITIPIDPFIIGNEIEIPKTIPFLTYNRTSGKWEQEGEGVLNQEKSAYVAKTTHLSEFNMDVFKDNPACVRFCLEEQLGPLYKVKITIPGRPPVTKTVDESNQPDPGWSPACPSSDLEFTQSGSPKCRSYLHLIYNLPLDTYISIQMLDAADVILNNYVVFTGSSGVGLDTDNTPPCPYSGCCEGGDCQNDILILNEAGGVFDKSPTLAEPQVTNCAGGPEVELAWYYEPINPPLSPNDFVYYTIENPSSFSDCSQPWAGPFTFVNGTNANFVSFDDSLSPIYKAKVNVADGSPYLFRVEVIDGPDTKTSECECLELSAGCSSWSSCN